jgi:DedD protein
MPAKMEGFAVQVGAFGDEAKLQQVRDKLAAAKITTYTEPSGNLTRLRVGPFPTREQAEKSATTVRRTVPEAKVVPLP